MNDYSLLNSVDLNVLDKGFLTVSDRYYEHKYCTKFSTEQRNIDQRVSFHTNRICMISLAEHHTIIKNNIEIKKINCIVENKVNRLSNTASGKGKRGAQKLYPNSILCYIECENGESFPVYSCVNGKLLEINENLLTEPRKLIDKPVSEGFIALVLPILNTYNDMKESMLTKEQYLSQKNIVAIK